MGVNPFNSYSPHLPLKRQYLSSGDEAPCIFGHPPQSYFSSALMSLPPAASSPVCIQIPHILLVHSSERMLQVRVFSSATGADLMAAGILSDQCQDKGLSKALTLKEMRIPVFNRVPWLQNLSLFRMLGRSGWATCFRKTLKSFPIFSSTCIALQLQLMLQSVWGVSKDTP